MTRRAWLRSHAFLLPVAGLHERVEAALAGDAAVEQAEPRWDDYSPDHSEGIPLLRSAAAAVDLEPGGVRALALVERLSEDADGGTFAHTARALAEELRRSRATAQAIADWLLGEGTLEPSSPGLLRFLGWTAMRLQLRETLASYSSWREEDRWQRSHCPACGSAPAMAQLVGIEPGHARYLACGCCATRWRWRRTACPFCGIDPHRLSVVTVVSEPGLRIDHCEACRGYLKVYVGQGHESLMLADWTTLHLDLLARERGLVRRAASLYDLGALLDPPAGPA